MGSKKVFPKCTCFTTEQSWTNIPDDNCSTFTNIFSNHSFTNFNYTYRYNENIPNSPNNCKNSLNNFFHTDNNNSSRHPSSHADEVSNFSNESIPPLSHISTMTLPINNPKNHYKWGDCDGNVFEKKIKRNIWHYCILEENLIYASHWSSRERL